MTRQEIIEMARQAGFVCLMPDEAIDMIGGIFEGDANLLKNFEAFAKLVAEKEREACANVCDDELKKWGIFDSDVGDVSKAIRARGDET